MWHFSMQGLPVPTITCRDRELLPHVFTFTRRSFSEGWPHCSFSVGSYFLWHFLLSDAYTSDIRLLAGALLCAVRTFLPIRLRRTER